MCTAPALVLDPVCLEEVVDAAGLLVLEVLVVVVTGAR